MYIYRIYIVCYTCREIQRRWILISCIISDFMVLLLLWFFGSLLLRVFLTHVTLFHHNVSNTPANGVKSVPNYHRVPTRLNSPHSHNPQITSRGSTNWYQRSNIVFSANQMEWRRCRQRGHGEKELKRYGSNLSYSLLPRSFSAISNNLTASSMLHLPQSSTSGRK